jgi:hypothetical protein
VGEEALFAAVDVFVGVPAGVGEFVAVVVGVGVFVGVLVGAGDGFLTVVHTFFL